MFQFVQSIWLWTAAGIIVPVIIHLWNVRDGKTLKVGSIALFTESAKSPAKSFKLTDLLLLLLRCLLLIVLAMLIAKPFYEKQLESQKDKGWILIERSKVHELYNKFKPAIDSLIKSGYAFHYFNSKFDEAKFEEVLKLPVDTTKETETSFWVLLKELDQRVSSKLPVYLITDNSLRRFTGSRPAVSLHLKWNLYPSSDTPSTWVEKAFKTTNDSLRLMVGNSRPTGTSYTYQNISHNNSNKKFDIKTVAGKTFIRYNDTFKSVIDKAVEVDTTTLTISIFTDKFVMDARYLKAAIDAVRDFTKYKIKMSLVNKIESIPPNCNWLFWLSEETIPASLLKNNVFVYEKGKVENLHSQIIIQGNEIATSTDQISLTRSIRNNTPASIIPEIVWKDGFGEPVLNVQKQQASVYHFYSRFNPQWNDLPWSSQFPQIIFDLLFNREESSPELSQTDKRIIDATQIQPVITREEDAAPKESLIAKIDLSKVFWLIAFILFIVERMVSSRSKKEEVYG